MIESSNSIDGDDSLHRDLFQGRRVPARMPPRRAARSCCSRRIRSPTPRGRARPSTRSTPSRATPTDADIRRRVDAIARRHRIDRIAALDDFDVEMGGDAARAPAGARHGAARPRAASATSSPCARRRARSGFPVPEFSPVFNDQEVNEWTAPRPGAVGAEAAVVGGGDRDQEGRRPRRALARARRRRRRAVQRRARAVRARRRLSRRLDCLGRRRSCSRSRSSTAGRRWRSRIRAASSSRGGCRTIRRRRARCCDANRAAAGGARPSARRLAHGIHQARRRGSGDGYRVPRNIRPRRRRLHRRHDRGGDRHQPVARVGEDRDRRRATAPTRCRAHRRDYAGIVLSLARQEEPDMSAYTDPEIVTTHPEASPCRADRALAGSGARRSADRRLHAALLSRLLRHRAAAGTSRRMIKRTLRRTSGRRSGETAATSTSTCRRPTAPAASAIRSSTCRTGRTCRIPRPRLPARGSSTRRSSSWPQRGIEADRRRRAQPGEARLAEYSPFPDRRHGGGDGRRLPRVSWSNASSRASIGCSARAPSAMPRRLSGRRWAGWSACTRISATRRCSGGPRAMSPSLWFGQGAVLDFIGEARMPPRGGSTSTSARTRASARCATCAGSAGCWCGRASPATDAAAARGRRLGPGSTDAPRGQTSAALRRRRGRPPHRSGLGAPPRAGAGVLLR